jgi:hypothetical protein
VFVEGGNADIADIAFAVEFDGFDFDRRAFTSFTSNDFCRPPRISVSVSLLPAGRAAILHLVEAQCPAGPCRRRPESMSPDLMPAFEAGVSSIGETTLIGAAVAAMTRPTPPYWPSVFTCMSA